jgi:hypothetical protein
MMDHVASKTSLKSAARTASNVSLWGGIEA